MTAPLTREVDLQASYRRDHTETRTRELGDNPTIPSLDGPFPDVPYQTNTVSANQFTVGFRYRPVQGLALRTSYGEGILPPSFDQLAASPFTPTSVRIFRITDPKRGDTLIESVGKFTILGNLDLKEEHSRSWSAGVVLTPEFLPGFRLSVDYTRIRKTNEIVNADFQLFLDREDEAYSSRVLRDPLTPEDEILNYTGGRISELYVGYVNIARSGLEAYDVQTDYTWNTAFGAFTANAIASYQPHLVQQVLDSSDELDRAGYSGGALKLRGNAGLTWTLGSWSAGWNMQYFDAYRVYAVTASDTSRDNAVLSQGAALIPTQTYHDLFARYRFEGAAGFAFGILKNAELTMAVQNALDASPNPLFPLP